VLPLTPCPEGTATAAFMRASDCWTWARCSEIVRLAFSRAATRSSRSSVPAAARGRSAGCSARAVSPSIRSPISAPIAAGRRRGEAADSMGQQGRAMVLPRLRRLHCRRRPIDAGGVAAWQRRIEMPYGNVQGGSPPESVVAHIGASCFGKAGPVVSCADASIIERSPNAAPSASVSSAKISYISASE